MIDTIIFLLEVLTPSRSCMCLLVNRMISVLNINLNGGVIKMWDPQPGFLNPNQSTTNHYAMELQQVTQLLCVLVSSPIDDENNCAIMLGSLLGVLK